MKTLSNSYKVIIYITFAIVASAMSWIFFYDIFVSFNYSPLHYNKEWMGADYSPIYWFTLLSNLGILMGLVWITLAFISLVTKNERLFKAVNGEYVKTIFITFVVYIGVAFLITSYGADLKIYGRLDADWVNQFPDLGYNWLTPKMYGSLEMFTTSLKHILIPLPFIYLLFADNNYYLEDNKSTKVRRASVISILPVTYLVFVIISMAYFNTPTPYVFFDFSPTNLYPSFVTQSWISMLLNVIIIIIAFTCYWVFTYLVIWYWEWKKVKCV